MNTTKKPVAVKTFQKTVALAGKNYQILGTLFASDTNGIHHVVLNAVRVTKRRKKK